MSDVEVEVEAGDVYGVSLVGLDAPLGSVVKYNGAVLIVGFRVQFSGFYYGNLGKGAFICTTVGYKTALGLELNLDYSKKFKFPKQV